MNIIEINNVNKQYAGSYKKANCNISMDVRKGEILCIAGENGAGKTTLMKILCGLEKKDSGEITINGNIGMVHQHFMLFPEYTVAENIVMGMEPRKLGVFFDKKKADEYSEKIIKENNFSISSASKIKELTLGEMQQAEICRVLYRKSDIIVLDEPTSILTEYETKSLFNTLKVLKKEGKAIILITHKINEIKQVADRVAVLRQGELNGIFDVSGISAEEIAKLMVNSEIYPTVNFSIAPSASPSPLRENTPVISFENVTVVRRGQKRPLLDNVSFSVNSSEILGFAGVGGNGLGVIEAVLGGFLHPVSGKIIHKGNDISKLNTRKLREQGLAYVPADRIRVGSALNASIKENMIINDRVFTENSGKETEKLKKYNIDAFCLNEKASSLSGGNLQKLILAREIDSLGII